MTVAFEFSRELHAESCDWIEQECTDALVLHRAVGISAGELFDLQAAGIIPRPTYEIYDTGIVSPVAFLGTPGRHIATYYGPAVVGWLRRAATYRRHHSVERLGSALRAWLDRDFHAALVAYSSDASRFGWSHLFEAGTLMPERFASAAGQLWDEWLGGGWAVCLTRFSGYDVVNKDIELERIPHLADRNTDGNCEPELIDAMLRFDSIVRAFAPFERPMSSRRRVIDQVVMDHELPWPRPELGGTVAPSPPGRTQAQQIIPQRADI